jgi:serine/threonine-protein kinase
MFNYDLDANVRACVSCKRCYGSSVQFCEDCFVELVSIELVPYVIDERYQLERMISRGMLGVVFAAQDLEAGREVAVKVFHASALAEPRALDRFRREVEFASGLNHPRVAAVYAHGLLPNASAYVVTELARGETLRMEMKRTGKYATAAAVAVLSAIAEGLNVAHQAGLVHRDLKPECVIIEASDDSATPPLKVVDFSFARTAIGRRFIPGTTGRLQARGQLPLQPTYLSPEQFRGEEADLRSDIYSLGVIAYEMLTARPPFTARKTGDFGVQVLTARPPLPRTYNQEVNVLLQAEVMRALEKEPRQRHQSASEFKRALTSAMQISSRL